MCKVDTLPIGLFTQDSYAQNLSAEDQQHGLIHSAQDVSSSLSTKKETLSTHTRLHINFPITNEPSIKEKDTKPKH